MGGGWTNDKWNLLIPSTFLPMFLSATESQISMS